MKYFLKFNYECNFSNKRVPRENSFLYFSSTKEEVIPIIKLKKYYIFKMKDKMFEDFIFYTNKENVYEDR